MTEDSGFTFVDKRGAAGEDAVVTTSDPDPAIDAAASAADDAAIDSGEDDDLPGGVPDIYSILQYSLQMLMSTAWYKLGLLANPQTGEVEADLGQAKIAIDTVAFMAEKLDAAPDDAIPAEAKKELKRLVNDLRLNYVSRRDER